MNDREIIIGMLEEIFEEQYEHRRLITAVHTADHLISPGVTVQKHGRWEETVISYHDPHTDEYWDEFYYEHEACGYQGAFKFNYCPNCGAKMDGEA